jgi:AraC family transcriptional regulator
MRNRSQAHKPRILSSRCIPDRETPPDPRLLRVIDFMADRLGERLSLSDLARVAGLSPNHFARVFKRTFGMAPHRYLLEQRIACACELLGDPRHSLAEVSYAVGFSSQSHFNMVFRRYLRTTPALYRQRILCNAL